MELLIGSPRRAQSEVVWRRAWQGSNRRGTKQKQEKPFSRLIGCQPPFCLTHRLFHLFSDSCTTACVSAILTSCEDEAMMRCTRNCIWPSSDLAPICKRPTEVITSLNMRYEGGGTDRIFHMRWPPRRSSSGGGGGGCVAIPKSRNSDLGQYEVNRFMQDIIGRLEEGQISYACKTGQCPQYTSTLSYHLLSQ
jgi:hypothetical protein